MAGFFFLFLFGRAPSGRAIRESASLPSSAFAPDPRYRSVTTIPHAGLVRTIKRATEKKHEPILGK